jgi:hypothetical protein
LFLNQIAIKYLKRILYNLVVTDLLLSEHARGAVRLHPSRRGLGQHQDVGIGRDSIHHSGFNFAKILRAAFVTIFLRLKKLQSQTVSREKLSRTLLYEKGASKMCMKLTTVSILPNF